MFDINQKKRIVIKVGTSTLTHKTGRLNIRRMERFVKTLADIQNSGYEIILVSSVSEWQSSVLNHAPPILQ